MNSVQCVDCERWRFLLFDPKENRPVCFYIVVAKGVILSGVLRWITREYGFVEYPGDHWTDEGNVKTYLRFWPPEEFGGNESC